MAKHDEISSTEKLLNVIRANEEDVAPSTENKSPSPETTAPARSAIFGRFSFKKKLTVGVDIGPNQLRMAAVFQAGDKTPELVDYACLAYDPEKTPRNSPQFARFLKASLRDFCGSAKRARIWSVISSARVETRFIRIPKVAARQTANAVSWTYKKEVKFNEASDVFDFEVLGDVTDQGVKKLEVIAYSAPRQEVNELKGIFTKIGYPLTGMSIVPFAMQNFLRNQWVDITDKNVCNLFIGKDWSRIVIYSDGNLILSREIKSGIQSVIESIRENIGEPLENQDELVPEDHDEPRAADAVTDKKDYYDETEAQRLFRHFVQGESHDAVAAESDDLNGNVFEMIEPALERIVRQVERTLQHYALNYKNEKISKIYISGIISAKPQVLDYIGRQLDLSIEAIDPFAAWVTSKSQVDLPASLSERGAYTPAIGIALSNKSLTPNFIHTYKDKEEMASIARVQRIAVAGAFVFALLCTGTFYWQSRQITYKKTEAAQLQGQVDRYVPYVDENLIMQMVARVNQEKDELARNGGKYSSMALLNVVSKSTPTNIRLMRLQSDFGDLPQDNDPAVQMQANKKIAVPPKRLILEGVVMGDRVTLESALADYMVRLKKSPFFGKAVVRERTVDQIEDKDVMKFTAELELI